MNDSYWVFRNEDVVTLLYKYVQVEDSRKNKVLEILCSLSGISPIDGIMLLLNECAGIYFVHSDEKEDYDKLTFNINLFSNYGNICPFYWESETLQLFQPWICEIILSYSNSDFEYNDLYYLLETLVYDLMGTLHLPFLDGGKTSRSSTFSITHIRGEALIFSKPEIEDEYSVTI